MKNSYFKPKYLVIAGGCIILLVLASLLLFRDKFQSPPEKPDPDLLAKVGSHEIRAEQFRAEMARRTRFRAVKIDKRQLLEEMINYETFLVKAFKAGLDKDPEVVRSYRNLLVGKLKQHQLTPRIEAATMSDEDIQAHYEANVDAYTQPAKIRIAIIYMKTHPTMSSEKVSGLKGRMAEAREKALELSNVRGFGALSINYSEDQTSRYKGGDIGWVEEGRKYRWNPAVISAGFSMEKKDDISDIITTDNGLYLVKLMDQRKSLVTPLKKVKTRIRHKQLLEKRKAIEKAFQKKIRAATEIEIYPEALEAIPLPASSGLVPGKQKPPTLP